MGDRWTEPTIWWTGVLWLPVNAYSVSLRYPHVRRRGSVACIVTGWAGVRIFQNAHTISGAPPSHLCHGYRWSLPGVKRPRREANHPSPSNAEVKSECRYTQRICFHGVDGEIFTFTFTLRLLKTATEKGLRFKTNHQQRISTKEMFHSILLPTLCTYLIKNYHNSHLKLHTLKMSVMHN